MNGQPKVTVVVLTLGNSPELRACLASLARDGYPDLDCVVVVNAPAIPGLAKGLKDGFPKVYDITFTGRNLGFAAANNIGIAKAFSSGAELVLLLNDDAELVPGAVSALVEEANANPSAGMLGARIFYRSDERKISFSGAGFNRRDCSFSYPLSDTEDNGVPGAPVPTDYVSGCALMFGPGLVEKVGLLDEAYFLYWEDADWGLRAKAAGFSPVIVPSAKVLHRISFSMGGNDSPFKAYHKTRARLLFAARHAPFAQVGIVFAVAKDIAWLLLKSGVNGRLKLALSYAAGAADYFIGRTGPGPAWLKS